MSRAQRVRTDAGWHGRILGDNGETVWTTEVYTEVRGVWNALGLLDNLYDLMEPIELVDERDADD